jgi:hypothetical protein
MRTQNTLPTLLLLAWTPTVSAQFPSFPDSNAFWMMYVLDQPGIIDEFGFHMKEMNHDTLLNGQWYNSLWHDAEGEGGDFAGGIRSVPQGRVYYFHPNTNAEYLLYDFGVDVGDTVEAFVGGPDDPIASLELIHIVSIDSLVNENGTPFRQIGILPQWAFDSGELSSQSWTQGVGGTGGLFGTVGLLSLSPNTYLGCMEHNDSLWPGGVPGACTWTLGVHVEHGQVRASVTPNPSTGLFHFNQGSERITVFNAMGQLLFRTHGSTIDLGGYPPGIYTAVCQSAPGIATQRLVVVR